MCGKTSSNLLAVDCDSQSAYDAMCKELDAHGVPYWAFNSHNGRGCYLLRVKEGEVTNVTKATGKYKDVELWGSSHYVILPLSTHPSGELYRWRGDTEPAGHFVNDYETLPAVSVTALDWLGVTLLKDVKPQAKPFQMFGLSAEFSVLSERNRQTLAQGANDGQRNARMNALACDLKANDFEYAEIESLFLRAASMCKPVYEKHKALAVIKTDYRKPQGRAQDFYKPTEPTKPTAQLQRLYTFVNSYDWKATFGRKARTRRAVFMACIERSVIEGETFRATVRELAETVNRKYHHMSICLHDLLDAGLLKLVTSWNKSHSGGSVYAFGATVGLYPISNSITTTCNTNVTNWIYQKNTNTDAFNDVFGRLGGVAVEVLRVLQAKKYKSIYAISKDTSAAYSSVTRAVQRLVTHELAIHSKSEGLYYAEDVSESALLALSVKLETNGRAEMRRIEHGIDREIFINRNLQKAMWAYNDVTSEKLSMAEQSKRQAKRKAERAPK